MTVCCEVCQHPACWKAEIDIRRCALQNEFGYFDNHVHESKSSLRYDIRNECIVNADGSLPTYKTLDLLTSGFPSSGDSNNFHEKDVSESQVPHLPTREAEIQTSTDGEANQSSPFFTTVNKSLTNYLKKICDRRLEVEKLEQESSERVVFKTLGLEDVESFGHDEYTKVYTWVPGRKSRSKSADAVMESKENVLALKMIDGADLPVDCSLPDGNKHRQRLSSQQAGFSYKRRTIPYQIPPFGSEDRPDYLELLRYIDLTRIKCDKLSANNQNVRIPSALQTARLKLYDASNVNKLQKQIANHNRRNTEPRDLDLLKQDENQTSENLASPLSKTMYIKNGVVLPKSPVAKIPEYTKCKKRAPLPITKVSLPRRAIQKLPLFDHCSSSIKKTNLPDVTMQPISSSENTSIVTMEKSSMNASLVGDLELLNCDVLSSPDLARVPPCSPNAVNGVLASPIIQPMIRDSSFTSDTKNRIPSPLGSNKAYVSDVERIPDPSVNAEKLTEERKSGENLYVSFATTDDHLQVENFAATTRATPSAIMISKASKTGSPVTRNENEALSRNSPTTSLGSKTSLDGWLLDKEIMSRTYDKYQSFSPFKTPQCSAHYIKGDITEKTLRSNESRMMRSSASRRQTLPPSLHNLDQFLPGEEDTLRPNVSFTTRSLSPSRSMFIRQQKQPPVGTVPSEIMVSRFPLLPAITKSQKSLRSSYNENLIDDTDVDYPITPRGSVEMISCSIDDEYEEEVEEVLLNKEAFSAYDLTRCNDCHSVENEQQNRMLSQNDPQPRNTIPNNRSRHALNLDVSNSDPDNGKNGVVLTNQHTASNFLLLPTQKTDDQSLSSNHDEDKNISINLITDSSYNNTDALEIAKNLSNEVIIGVENENVSHINADVLIIPHDTSMNEDVSMINEEDILIRSSNQDIANIDADVSIDADDIDNKQDKSDRMSIALSSADSTTRALSSVSIAENMISPNQCSSENSPIVGDDMGITSISPESVNANIQLEITEESIQKIIVIAHRESDAKEIPENTCDANQNVRGSDSAEMTDGAEMTGGDLTVTGICVSGDLIVNDSGGSPNDSCENKEIVVLTNSGIVEKTSEMKRSQSDIVLHIDPSHLEPNGDDLSVVGTSRSFLPAERSNLSIVGSQIFKSSSQLIEDPVQSVMKDIFNNQIVEESSLYLTPKHADDFSEGLDLNLELDEEIVRAIHGLEEFVLDTYEVADES